MDKSQPGLGIQLAIFAPEARSTFIYGGSPFNISKIANHKMYSIYEREMAYGVSTQCYSSPRWLKMIGNRSSCQRIAEVNTKSSLECQKNLLMLIFYSFGD
ncbi:unnamed protein product [Caenorhabditis angaria]|uniref:Uncharacterized protein n=1 Tax=Caenorhabditis angaria TaxID=860376 RepID=A0A9P1IS48_9PELO|nr:unnamed protein product [Caenorhabditis angaria]